MPDTRPDGSAWPRISIVTPNYNYVTYIEETIRSVLLQGYPDLEYIVMDGGSKDGSVDLIRKYSSWLSYWTAGKDKGQADAINLGFARASGEIFNWINSDDFLMPCALNNIAQAFEPSLACVASPVVNVYSEGTLDVIQNSNLSARGLIEGKADVIFHQPGVWLSAGFVRKRARWRDDLHFVFDWVFMVEFLRQFPSVRYIDFPTATFRLHCISKTGTGFEKFEHEKILALRGMVNESSSAELKSIILRRLRSIDWWTELADIERSQPAGLTRAFTIAKAAIRHIPASVSRLTAGAIRRSVWRSLNGRSH